MVLMMWEKGAGETAEDGTANGLETEQEIGKHKKQKSAEELKKQSDQVRVMP